MIKSPYIHRICMARRNG